MTKEMKLTSHLVSLPVMVHDVESEQMKNEMTNASICQIEGWKVWRVPYLVFLNLSLETVKLFIR